MLFRSPMPDERMVEAATSGMLPLTIGGDTKVIVAPLVSDSRRLIRLVASGSELTQRIRITTAARMRHFVVQHGADEMERRAVDALRSRRPDLSAAGLRPNLLALVVLAGAASSQPRALTPAPTGIGSARDAPPAASAGATATQLLLNLSEPSQIERSAALAVDGVGLLRAELMLLEALDGMHPRALLERGQERAHVRGAALDDALARLELEAALERAAAGGVRLAEDRTSCLHPFPGPAAAIGALEFSREPGTHAENLAGREGDLGLVIGDIAPVRPDRLAPVNR